MQQFKIYDDNGAELLINAKSIHHLRYQIAPHLKTWSPCVSLFDDGSTVADEDWNNFVKKDDIIILKHNIMMKYQIK